jgi:hypothetical protein
LRNPVKTVVDCKSAGDRDVADLYLAGRLSEDVAEAFELHYLGCKDCWEFVEGGARLRASFGKAAVARAPAAARSDRSWLPLAAAAVIALAAFGVWRLTRPAPVEPVTPVSRAVGGVLDLKLARGQREIEVNWLAQPAAAVYRIEVVASDGARIWSTETREPHVSIAPAAFPAPSKGRRDLIRVEALDSMGEVVARSAPAALPEP